MVYIEQNQEAGARPAGMRCLTRKPRRKPSDAEDQVTTN